MIFSRLWLVAFAALLAATPTLSRAAVIAPVEDVMTSGFFSAPDSVRGYSGDNRNVHRVSNDNAFGVSGAETVYVTFDSNDFSSFTSPIASAFLTVESASGGFGADAGPGNPFTVSAHAVDTDPLTAITDDTNPGGPIDWLTFLDNNILAADPAALTVVDGFGPVTFDVTSVVNDWIAGTNTVFALALTGKNDTSGTDFLHGFLNNTENPGSTFLTVSSVPEPTAMAMLASLGLTFVFGFARRRRR